MKKKLLSILISISILTAMLQPLTAMAATWAGGVSVPGLSGGYYQISTGEELAWFAQQVNNGSADIKGMLTADITLNDTYSTANNWVPIGTEADPFKGEFNGNHHTITGLYINSTEDNIGLFGYVEGNKPEIDDNDDSSETIFQPNPKVMIQNINLKSAKVNGNQNVGGICGYIFYGIIKNCTFEGTINAAASNMGGICGYITDYSRIQRSFTTGSLNGHIRSGGICGFVNSNSVVEDCYSTGAVRSDASLNGNAGGIAGTISASKIEGCYFLGNVMGPKKVGGIAGTNSYSTIIACYTLGQVYTSLANNTQYIAAVVGYSLGGSYYNCYYNEIECLWADENATERTIDQMKKFSFSRELNENGNSFTYDYMVINNGLPVLAWTLETSVWAGGIEEPSKDSADYYLITTADELAWFARLVNGTIPNVDANPSAKAKVTENILLNIFITVGSEDTNVWTPIGTAESPFNGIFIGNGFNIAGLHANGNAYQGLFGYIGENGTVSEVILLDGLIIGTENVGGIAGYSKGNITDSCNDTQVQGVKYVGGVCGNNYGTVKTSYNVGTVECTSASGSHIGGVTGSNTRGTVKECFNNGKVKGAAGNYYGGVCGNNTGTITDCYNAGSINGGYYIGGLIGYNNYGTVHNCYNRGNVNSQNTMNTNVNNFIGFNNGSCSISNCYYDTSIEHSVMNSANGAIGKVTAGLTGQNIASSLGFTAGIWSSKASQSYFNYYPQLLSIATSNYAKIKSDSLESTQIVDSVYNLQVKVDGREYAYYKSFPEALSGIGTKKGTIILIKDITLSQTINITNDVTIYGLNFNRTIKRNPLYTSYLFNVTGKLTLGDYKNGSDSTTLLTIDGNGNNVTAAAPLINIAEHATLTTYPGYEITNVSSSVDGSVFYINSDATADINGGIITSNQSAGNGGAIYNDMGTINITAGEISSNTASLKGGAIYNNYGVINISGGSFTSNYGKQLGGAVYTLGSDALITVSGTAAFTGNYSNAGGAFYVNSGALNITEGTISNNFAYNKRSSSATSGGGGAITIAANGIVSITGGLIENNYTYNNLGDGFAVADFGTLKLGGSVVFTNNDIYLHKNKTVEITEALTGNGTVVTITPYTYVASTYVLSGTAMGLSYKKVAITPQTNAIWNVNSSGYLMDKEIVTVASLSKFGAYSVEYISLAEAVANVAAGEEGIITIIGNNTISETIKIYGDVTILSETDKTFTSMRSGDFNGTMFEVQTGGTLRLGYSETEVENSGDVSPDDEESEGQLVTDSVGGEYHLDGGNNYYGATGTSIITVKNGGSLYIYDDLVIENGYSSVGTICVSGTMYMYGGTITQNFAANGGGINIGTSGKAYLYGGTITKNYLVGGGYGKAIYNQGVLTRAAHSYVYYRNDVPVATQKSFITITPDNDVYLANNKAINIADVESRILLSDTSDEIPETNEVTATTMMLTLPTYSIGKVVIKGTDVGLHYNSFAVTADGYYILPDGSLNVDLLVAAPSSTYTITRGDVNFLTGIDPDLNMASYIKNQFINTDTVEVVSADGTVLTRNAKVKTGDMIRLYNAGGTEIADLVYIVIIGDVDCDSNIDGMDSMLVSCYIKGKLTSSDLKPWQIRAADVDGSSSVNNADEQYIQQCGALKQTVQQY